MTAEQANPPTRPLSCVSLLVATNTDLPAYEKSGLDVRIGWRPHRVTISHVESVIAQIRRCTPRPGWQGWHSD